MRKNTHPACHSCIHYFITWDAAFPYGCHAMGFKTRRNPGVEVRQVMHGQTCLLYSPKKSMKRPSRRIAVRK